ncbi:MAG: (Fe-S)-binding protein [Fimbriimonadaceae bacterium]
MSDAAISDVAAHCIRCGFCIESCPTFVLTGDESQSPRGRIYLSRRAAEGDLDWQDAAPALDTCLGCRACEPACPSGVAYGSLLEMARERVVAQRPDRGTSLLLWSLTEPKGLAITKLATRFIGGQKPPAIMAKRLSDQPPQAVLPRQDHRKWGGEVAPGPDPVFIVQGCVMDAFFSTEQEATRRLLRRVNFQAGNDQYLQGCCGALHAHAGHWEDAVRRARILAIQAKGNAPIVTNSAGCGSFLKEVGHREKDLASFSSRVRDISEVLAERGLPRLLEQSPGLDTVATYHPACHLANAQRVIDPPLALMDAVPGLRRVELPDAGTCCGSAGIYNLTQPTMARRLLDRKMGAVMQSHASVVVTGNPGCHAWIAQGARERGGQVRVEHTVTLLEAAFSGWPQER